MIISISGLIGSGKDTAASHLVERHGFVQLAFADSLKEAVSSIFGWDLQMLRGTTKESRAWRECVDSWWSKRLGMNITPRWVLQNLGTDVFRNNFHSEIWLASVERKLLTMNQHVVITDARFANELQLIKQLGGKNLLIHRGETPSWYSAASRYNLTKCSESLRVLERNMIHASEYSHVGLSYDFVINNNKSLDELQQNVDSVVTEIAKFQ